MLGFLANENALIVASIFERRNLSMGILFEVKKNSATEIRLTEYSIKDFSFTADASESPNLRHNDIINGVIISGLIDPEIMSNDTNSTNRAREVDSARRLANWAIIPEFLDCYRDISYKISDARGVVVKEDGFDDCFVVDYEENYSNDTGTGSFRIVIRVSAEEARSAQSNEAFRRSNSASLSQRQDMLNQVQRSGGRHAALASSNSQVPNERTVTPQRSMPGSNEQHPIRGSTPANTNTEQAQNDPSQARRARLENVDQILGERAPSDRHSAQRATHDASTNRPTDGQSLNQAIRQPPTDQ